MFLGKVALVLTLLTIVSAILFEVSNPKNPMLGQQMKKF